MANKTLRILIADEHPSQLLQLENGGDSMFYSPAIKAHLGRKLIRKLQSRLDNSGIPTNL